MECLFTFNIIIDNAEFKSFGIGFIFVSYVLCFPVPLLPAYFWVE